MDLDIPDVLSAENVSSDAVTHFSVAFRCWRLLYSDTLRIGNWAEYARANHYSNQIRVPCIIAVRGLDYN